MLNRTMRKRLFCLWSQLISIFFLAGCHAVPASLREGNLPVAAELQATPVSLPGGSAGIGFDDLLYSPQLKQVIVPAGRTGSLDLVDPQTLQVTALNGFSAQDQFGGGHGDGTTSADFGRGYLFAIDRTGMQLDVVDLASKTIAARAPLTSSPDYVRFVEATGEVWVTEPDSEQIEVFSLGSSQPPTPTAVGVIHVSGGPESLVIDPTRQQAYTHLWAGVTVAINLKTRTLVSKWSNGCISSRGIALDETRGFLFAGCVEGKVFVLDVEHDGRQLSNFGYGLGVDVISYNPKLGHLYLPAASSESMAILGVSASGELTLLGTVKTAQDAHCVTADEQGNAWVCDPSKGQLLLVKDTLPPTK